MKPVYQNSDLNTQEFSKCVYNTTISLYFPSGKQLKKKKQQKKSYTVSPEFGVIDTAI